MPEKYAMKVKRGQSKTLDYSSLCSACAPKLDAVKKYKPMYEGNKHSSLLLIRFSLEEEEIKRQQMWCTISGQNFVGMFDECVTRIENVCSIVLVRCAQPKYAIKHIRGCATGMYIRGRATSILEWIQHWPWKLIVCSGRLALQHSLMRGGAPPPMDVLAERFVKMPETGNALITVIPDTQGMCVSGPDDLPEVVQARGMLMHACLRAIGKEYQQKG